MSRRCGPGSEPVPRWTRLWHIPIAGRRADSTGRRNTLITEVLDGTSKDSAAAGAGQGATAVGGGSGDAGADALTRATGAVACRTARVLAAGRDGGHHGRGVGWGGRVMAGGATVISPR